jgi:hypothetical protein
VIAREPQLRELVRGLAREHAAIARCLAREPAWAALLEAGQNEQSPPGAAVASVDGLDVVATAGDVDECDRASGPADRAVALATDIRLPGLQRLVDGTARDAAQRPARDWLLPLLHEAGFVRSGASVAARFRQAHSVAVVDGPVETIAAWKRLSPERFAQLLDRTIDAAVDAAPRAGRDQLERITRLDDPGERRAALWWWFAQRLFDADTGVALARASDGLRGLTRAVHDDAAAPRDDGLDANDRQAIRAICLQAACELGVAG